MTQWSAKWLNWAAWLLLLPLLAVSLSLGVADFSWARLFDSPESWQLLLVSRVPRTLALILAGVSLAVGGMMMQIVMRNRFVEPSMVGATQSAVLGVLLASLLLPASALWLKMAAGAVAALVGLMLFMLMIRRLPPSQWLMVPLVGMVFGGVIESVSLFVAYETEAVQLLTVWQLGDFSGVMQGNYELLWLTGIMAAMAYVMADRLTVVGLGDAVATSLGLNHKAVVWSALSMVAMITALVVVTVGAVPFVGLVVPNIVSRLMGDYLRRSLPAVALLGAAAVLACDIVGRWVRYPFEIPVATVFGVLGTVAFLFLLMRRPAHGN